MDKNNFQDFITAYLDDELSNDEKKEFENILNSNPQCKQQLDEVQNLISTLNSAPEHKTSSDFESKLYQRIAGLEQESDVTGIPITKDSSPEAFEKSFKEGLKG